MINFGRTNRGALAYLEASRPASYGIAATPALQNLMAAGPQNAIARVSQEYDQYARLDNRPGDKDPRRDFVELSGSLGTTEVALAPLVRGPYGEIRGYTSRFESKTQPGSVEVFAAEHRSTTDGSLQVSHAELVDGPVRGGTLAQKQDIISYHPLRHHDHFIAQTLDSHASLTLFQRLESRAQG